MLGFPRILTAEPNRFKELRRTARTFASFLALSAEKQSRIGARTHHR